MTAAGCRDRRRRLLDAQLVEGPIVLADPLSLRYFADAFVDPFHLGADYGGLLVIAPDGQATLYHDSRASKSIESAQVDDREPVVWYDGKHAGQGVRRTLLQPTLAQCGGRVHDALADPVAPQYWSLVDEMRLTKFPDEVEQLKVCMRAGEIGHAWALKNVKPGMTELDVYTGISQAVAKHLGFPAVVYGDFAVSPGMAKRGGPPDAAVTLKPGDLMILDFSVVVRGYRGDFTNTVCVGGSPTADQQHLLEVCLEALSAGESGLRAGATCLSVYEAMRGVFDNHNLGANFPHHAGHGLGLSHPEPPMLVESATETLAAGNVVTLEPGVYVDGVGGARIEHNYLVTERGYERLSHHELRLA